MAEIILGSTISAFITKYNVVLIEGSTTRYRVSKDHVLALVSDVCHSLSLDFEAMKNFVDKRSDVVLVLEQKHQKELRYRSMKTLLPVEIIHELWHRNIYMFENDNHPLNLNLLRAIKDVTGIETLADVLLVSKLETVESMSTKSKRIEDREAAVAREEFVDGVKEVLSNPGFWAGVFSTGLLVLNNI